MSVERLEAEWAARAAELGFGQREIEACLYRAWEREPELWRPSACSTSSRPRRA